MANAELPAWADRAVGFAEPNHYFDAEREARMLSTAQRQGLPSLVAIANAKLAGPDEDDRDAIADHLLSICARVSPGMAADPVAAWVTGLVESFLQTPADLLRAAVEKARYRQFQFLNEVGPWIAAQVEEPARHRKIALQRLRDIQARAAALPPPGDAKPSPEEVDKTLAEFGIPRAPAPKPRFDPRTASEPTAEVLAEIAKTLDYSRVGPVPTPMRSTDPDDDEFGIDY